VKRRVALEIHREDHKVDALGLIFLGAVEQEQAISLVRSYLGPHASLKRVELEGAVLRVEADVRDFPEESQNLVRSARELLRRGVVRGAIGHMEEALRLSALNADALKSLGRIYYRHRHRGAARELLTRAREVSPNDLEVLRLLAEIALHEDRRLAARDYLERVLKVNPADRRARVALARLAQGDADRVRALEPAHGAAGSGATSDDEAPSESPTEPPVAGAAGAGSPPEPRR
jgi:cytochrome c-type biogenesis protein CcmH/NrfG